ncbi:MAG: dTDP-4-dehydrorhamnose reductase [Bacteroidetes bacterium]|nr:dTDP-4-dehydrorhamnose reductase [Bacteroidota bacterium]
MKIIVTGGNGQLGNCIRKISKTYPNIEFFFYSSSELDITNKLNVEEVFRQIQPKYCINAAAYTAVDQAEKEPEKAMAINEIGVGNLASVCKHFGTVLIHISTDYVFDGNTNIPYDENAVTAPIGVYGKSKLLGEQLATKENPETIIIRTSWLYSEFNKNFVNTMLNLFQQKEELNIVNDQFGQPTNANNLAEAIMTIIMSNNKKYGVFHFSNFPETTWYQFAEKIKEITNSKIILNPITTDQYPTPAKRPFRSTFNLEKIQNVYGVVPENWTESLEKCLKHIQ